MKQEIRDILGVPGHVVAHRPICNRAALCDEARDIIDRAEIQGFKTLGQIPEGKDKERLREIMDELGLEVAF